MSVPYEHVFFYKENRNQYRNISAAGNVIQIIPIYEKPILYVYFSHSAFCDLPKRHE